MLLPTNSDVLQGFRSITQDKVSVNMQNIEFIVNIYFISWSYFLKW